MRTEKLQEKGQEMADQAQEWQQAARQKVQDAREAAEGYFQENAWSSLAIAAGVGCGIGFLIAKLTD